MTDINFSGLWRVNLVEHTDNQTSSNIIDEVYFEFRGEALLFMKIYNDPIPKSGNYTVYTGPYKVP
jgi:hypothetical protein